MKFIIYIYTLSNILRDQIDLDTMDGVCGEFRVTYKIAFGDMNGINGRYRVSHSLPNPAFL